MQLTFSITWVERTQSKRVSLLVYRGVCFVSSRLKVSCHSNMRPRPSRRTGVCFEGVLCVIVS